MSVATPDKTTLSVEAPVPLRRQLEQLAERDAISLSAVIRQLLSRAVRQEVERRG